MTETDHPVDQAIIGCWLSDADIAEEACELITPGHFDGIYAHVYEILQAMRAEGIPIDVSTLFGRWRKTHDSPLPPEITNSQDAAPSPNNCPIYVEDIIERHKRRMLLQASYELYEGAKGKEKTVDQLLQDAEEIITTADVKRPKITGSKECWRTFMTDLQRRESLKGRLAGMATGFHDLDKLTEGLQPRELFVIGARPSQGKTALGVNIAVRACLLDKNPTLFVTLEMSEAAITRRMLSQCMSVPIAALKSGMLTHDEAERSIEFSKLFCSSPLHFVDGLRGMCGGELTSVVRRAVRKHGIKLVIVDYLQKIKPSAKHEKRTYEVAEVSQKLKAIASDMNISVVALAQLSRDNEKLGRTPMPSDLADSSQIERDADVILLIYHEKQEDGSRVPKLILAKQRDGDVGLINVQFSKQFARFESVSYRQEEE